MSDIDKPSTTGASSGSKFSERELQLLCWAMQSLKSGPPDIDYDKLAEFAGMSNPRSAYNAWAKIKGKLMSPSDGAVSSTPKKGGAKKKTVKDDGSEDGDVAPKNTPRKRSAKKQDVDGQSSPKKKGGKGKKAANGDAKIKAEPDDFDDLEEYRSSMKAEDVEEEDEDEIEDEV